MTSARGPRPVARRARLGALAALVAMGLVVVGCAPAVPPVVPPPPGSTPPTPPTSPPPYPDRLTRTDREVAAALAAIGRAPDPLTLARTVLAASGVVSAAAQRLTAGPVPPAVAGVNAALAGTLHQFAVELAYLSQQVNQQVICTGSTAANAITTAPSMAALRAEASRLSDAGYRWGEFLPAPKDPGNARLPNGRLVVDRRAGPPGNGQLTVVNQGTTDAVVSLAEGGSTVLELAVLAGRSAELTGIPDGSYAVYYLTGNDWDDTVRLFGRHCQFHRFTTPSTFTSRPVPAGTAYTAQTITISTGTGPDASAVAPDQLPR